MSTELPPQEVSQFIDSLKSVSLSTLNPEGLPSASYTPFTRLNDGYGIYISTLSEHTQHLLDNPHLSLMWIADEQDSSNVFARLRLIANATAIAHPRGSKHFEHIIECLTKRFPQMMPVLENLSDFVGFELQLNSCRFVKGFGQAYLSETGSFDTFKHISAKS